MLNTDRHSCQSANDYQTEIKKLIDDIISTFVLLLLPHYVIRCYRNGHYCTDFLDLILISGSAEGLHFFYFFLFFLFFIIWIKHGFSCDNIRQVPREVLKTEAEGRGFQHLPGDLTNVNALQNHVRSLLLHKN